MFQSQYSRQHADTTHGHSGKYSRGFAGLAGVWRANEEAANRSFNDTLLSRRSRDTQRGALPYMASLNARFPGGQPIWLIEI
jgi:hypothetical protein